jgi:hypothetical protein
VGDCGFKVAEDRNVGRVTGLIKLYGEISPKIGIGDHSSSFCINSVET